MYSARGMHTEADECYINALQDDRKVTHYSRAFTLEKWGLAQHECGDQTKSQHLLRMAIEEAAKVNTTRKVAFERLIQELVKCNDTMKQSDLHQLVGKHREALTLLREAYKHNSNDPKILCRLIKSLAAEKDYDTAHMYLAILKRTNEGHDKISRDLQVEICFGAAEMNMRMLSVDSKTVLGDLYEELMENQEKQQSILMLHTIDSDEDSTLAEHFQQLAEDIGGVKLESAIAKLKREHECPNLAEEFGNELNLLNSLAYFYLRRNKYKDAKPLVEEALAKEPHSLTALANQCEMFLMQYKFPEAEKAVCAMEKESENKEAIVTALAEQGYCYSRMGPIAYMKGIAKFTQAITMGHGHCSADKMASWNFSIASNCSRSRNQSSFASNRNFASSCGGTKRLSVYCGKQTNRVQHLREPPQQLGSPPPAQGRCSCHLVPCAQPVVRHCDSKTRSMENKSVLIRERCRKFPTLFNLDVPLGVIQVESAIAKLKREHECPNLAEEFGNELNLLNSLAYFYLRRNKYKDAMPLVEEALAKEPHSLTALANQCEMFLIQYKFPEAEKAVCAMEKESENKEAIVTALAEQGYCYTRMGPIAYMKAIAKFTQAITMGHGHCSADKMASWNFSRASNCSRDKVIDVTDEKLTVSQCFELACELGPSDYWVLERAGKHQRHRRQYEKALELLWKAHSIYSTAFNLHHLGLTYKSLALKAHEEGKKSE
ncbi:unnamed protein product [Lampetra fluviatilis]